jgi:hypothetical protein
MTARKGALAVARLARPVASRAGLHDGGHERHLSAGHRAPAADRKGCVTCGATGAVTRVLEDK